MAASGGAPGSPSAGTQGQERLGTLCLTEAPLLGLSPSYFWDLRELAPPALGTSGPELWATSGVSGLTWVCRRH